MNDGEIFSPEGARRRPNGARRPLAAITNNSPGAGLSPGKLAFPVKQEIQKPPAPPKEVKAETKPAPKEKGSNKAAIILGAVALAAVVAGVYFAMPTSSPSVAPQQPPAPVAAPPAVEEHEVIVEEEYDLDDWAELSPGQEDLFEGAGEDEDFAVNDVPWSQSLISGPVQVDVGILSGVDSEIVSGGMAGVYARLAPNGEMFLFADVVDEAPVAMLSLDGCATQHNLAPQEPPAGCFAIYPARGGWGVGCVGDVEEARDWEDAMKQSPCD
eukprot:CAMPEP_0114126300 /NCGR_PEP_ID=MMETSP0043_2-20121206/9760_1 /TAXON_ID=464988 /ORGANISM="Hemiselmis andersenii, Strain CCMP644" /LENGTH=269 /DNA_ID=CAMNT_0001219283 /DNA_START=87 /DNA_END=896 /DNA_ORIENTATION=-